MNKYQQQIDHLDLIINNWESIKNHSKRFVRIYTLEGRVKFDRWQGLCANVKLNLIKDSDIISMFSSWKHYSGRLWYPVAGVDEYINNVNKFKSDLRLDLAKHCLNWLKENGDLS